MSDKPVHFLEPDVFKLVVQHTPLISLDLVVKDSTGRVLLGLRNNRPAHGCYFVPGGRIAKNETLTAAFKRLCKVELGLDYELAQAQYLGLYEHFYPDSALDEAISTHYVVNAFSIQLDVEGEALSLPTDQHNQYLWLSEQELLAREDVHLHSQWYFMDGVGVK